MEISDQVYTVFSAEIESGRTPVISVPERELRVGDLEAGERYRVAVLPPMGESESATGGAGAERPTTENGEPPVEVGDSLEVEIEDIGEQGDGIAKIGPGYVIFVPDTGIGDRVEIEITDARDNFAFSQVLTEEPVSE